MKQARLDKGLTQSKMSKLQTLNSHLLALICSYGTTRTHVLFGSACKQLHDVAMNMPTSWPSHVIIDNACRFCWNASSQTMLTPHLTTLTIQSHAAEHKHCEVTGERIFNTYLKHEARVKGQEQLHHDLFAKCPRFETLIIDLRNTCNVGLDQPIVWLDQKPTVRQINLVLINRRPLSYQATWNGITIRGRESSCYKMAGGLNLFNAGPGGGIDKCQCDVLTLGPFVQFPILRAEHENRQPGQRTLILDMHGSMFSRYFGKHDHQLPWLPHASTLIIRHLTALKYVDNLIVMAFACRKLATIILEECSASIVSDVQAAFLARLKDVRVLCR